MVLTNSHRFDTGVTSQELFIIVGILSSIKIAHASGRVELNIFHILVNCWHSIANLQPQSDHGPKGECVCGVGGGGGGWGWGWGGWGGYSNTCTV